MTASHDTISQTATAASTLPVRTSGERSRTTTDLVDAVNRQNTFIDALAKIGWLRADADEVEVLHLQRAVIRYRTSRLPRRYGQSRTGHPSDHQITGLILSTRPSASTF